jgi:ribosomal protein S18 acetylase RimI-like enzyme
MACIISEAKLGDAEGITFVQKTTWLATYPNDQAGISYQDIAEKVSHFGQGMRNNLAKNDPNVMHWVAKDADKIIGMCVAAKGTDKNTLGAIYVLPEYQGKHVGSQLLDKALAWLGREKDIVLGVVAYNQKAIGFYKSHGFIEHGARHDTVATLPSGKVLPELEMILKSTFSFGSWW